MKKTGVAEGSGASAQGPQDEELLRTLRGSFVMDVEGQGFDHWDYLYRFGSTAGALLCARLFVPEFVEMFGCVLLKRDRSEGEMAALKAAAESGRLSPEFVASFNCVEIGYLFNDRRSSDEDDLVLAKSVAEAWRGRLKLLYPERTFEVVVLTPEETKSVAAVQFREVT